MTLIKFFVAYMAIMWTYLMDIKDASYELTACGVQSTDLQKQYVYVSINKIAQSGRTHTFAEAKL